MQGPSAGLPDRKNLAQGGLLLLLRAYRVLLSPLFAGSCRFYPSCSQYASEAIERHGAGRGAWLAGRRLLRCHPFGSSGYDPVPSRTPQL